MRILTLGFLLGSTVALLPSLSLAAEHIGKVSAVIGTVQVERAGKDMAIELKADDEIFLNDTILTDEGDYAALEFIDETTITLSGADGSLSIDEYVFDPEKPEAGKARFNVLRASFEYIIGELGKNGSDARIGLDFGSIGIRGTHILRSMKDGECWIYLEDGKIRVSNNTGIVTLNPGDGTRLKSLDSAPSAVKPWGEENIAWIKGEVAKPAQEKGESE